MFLKAAKSKDPSFLKLISSPITHKFRHGVLRFMDHKWVIFLADFIFQFCKKIFLSYVCISFISSVESDPGVFTELISSMGATGLEVAELWSVERDALAELEYVFPFFISLIVAL